MFRLVLTALPLLASCAGMPSPPSLPAIPEALAGMLPPECRQMVMVTAPGERATTGRLWRCERGADMSWQSVDEAATVRLGRHGLAWGLDEPLAAGCGVRRIKREGDGCSPVGVFAIPAAFGSRDAPAGLLLPYLRCTQHHWGIDDTRSRHYNRIVDAREVACDWENPETMIPGNGCYELGAVIGHNPRCVPGAGSCIFFHVWQSPETPTSGCTAMSLPELRRLLLWLDPGKQPRLVQFVLAGNEPE